MSDQPDIPRKLRAKFEKVTSDLAIERQKLEAAKKSESMPNLITPGSSTCSPVPIVAC
jgi:hypothetical protein